MISMNEEKRPFIKALEILLEEKRTGRLINFVLIPVLVILAVLLPPISLVDRALASGFTTITLSGGSVLEPDGAQLTILPEGLSQRIRVRLTSLPRLDFLEGKTEEKKALESMPSYLDMKSPLYLLEVRGPMPEASFLTIPIPNDAEPLATLDIYQWTGTEWQWLPHKIIPEDDVIETWFSSLPRAIAVMQTGLRLPSVAAELGEGDTMAEAESDLLATVSARGLFLQNDGVSGEGTIGRKINPSAQASDYLVIPTLENRMKGVIRDDLTHNILTHEDLRRNHIQEIVALVVENDYAGIRIDYGGIAPSLQEDFTAFIAELADQLHAEGKLLTLGVETPVQVAEDHWDTGGYDWEALGRVVDSLQLPALPLPEAYASDGQMEALLNYVVGLVDRYKVHLILSAQAHDLVGDQEAPLSYQEALGRLSGKIALPSKKIKPGETLTMDSSSLKGWKMKYQKEAHTYQLIHKDKQGKHTVFLENAESIAHKLELARAFNLKGVMVKGLLDKGCDEGVWEALSQYASAMPCTMESQFAILWQVTDNEGRLVTEEVCPLDDPTFSWTVPEVGKYTISYALSDDGGQTSTVAGGEAVLVAVASPTRPKPTPTPAPTGPTPTPPPSTKPSTTPTPTPVPQAPPPTAGTGFAYAIQVELEGGGSKVVATVQGLRMNWIKEQIRWREMEPSPGNIEWARLDGLVNLANGGGLNILFSVVSSPPWANWAQSNPQTPADFAAYANFVGALAGRYCGRVQAYEIWNEENLLREWYGQIMSPSQYVSLLQAAYTSIKAACPQALVISGAPTPAGDTGASIDDLSYLRQAYAAGLGRWCDGVGVHPSGHANPPDSTVGTSPAPSHNNHRSFFFLDTMQSYRQAMVDNGDANKRLWPTEFGWGVTSNPHPGYEYEAYNTWELQAQYIMRAFEMARGWGWVGPMFLWNLNWAVFEPGGECAAFSILAPDWSHRPAYDALATR